MLLLSDFATAAAAPLVSLQLRSQFEIATSHNGTFAVYAIASSTLSLLLLWSTGCLRATWKYFALEDAARATQAIALGLAIGALCGFSYDRLQGVARTVPLIQGGLQIVAFVGIRFAFQWFGSAKRSGAGDTKHVLVIGSTKAASTYLNAAHELSGGSIQVVGFLTDERSMVGQTIHGRRVLGMVSDIEEIVSTLQVHGVDLWKLAVAIPERALQFADARAIDAAIQKFKLPRINVDAALAEFLTGDEDEGDMQAAAEIQTWKPLYTFTKRSIDLFGATFLLLLVAPIILVLCGIVAADVGFPILFWQQRLGKNGKRLTVYKFRTMRAPLDSAGRRIPDANRVSAVGYWMRKLRLDELPQLLSILKGDMSFVGPRPLLPIDQPSDAARRLSVVPGLTGWAQVHGGNLVAIEDKNALDLWYVAHSSLWLDIEIALRTIQMLFKGDNLDGHKIAQAKDWMRDFDLAGA